MRTATLPRHNDRAQQPSKVPAQSKRSVVVIGKPSELRTEVTRELAQNDASVTVIDHRAATSTAASDSIRGSPNDTSDSLGPNPSLSSFIVVTAKPWLPRSRRGVCEWRARAAERGEQQRFTDTALTVASTVSECRVLVLCDVRRASKPADAIRWARQLALGIGYEAKINGTSVRSTSYLIVGKATSVAEAAQVATDWHSRPERTRREAAAPISSRR